MSFTLTDGEKSLSITADTMDSDDPAVESYMSALSHMNDVMSVSTVAVSGMTTVFTMKDARTLTYVLDYSPPDIRFSVTSTDWWTGGEFDLIRALAQSISVLTLTKNMTALTVTFA